MSVMRDTSQVSIGPNGPFKHSPFGDSLRHVATAPLSFTLDAGANAIAGWVERWSEFYFIEEG